MNQIAWNQFTDGDIGFSDGPRRGGIARVDADGHSASDCDGISHHGSKTFGGAIGAELLKESQNDADEDHDRNDDPACSVVRSKGDPGKGDQKSDEGIIERFKKLSVPLEFLLVNDFVWAMLNEPRLDFF